jgi:hypothetical protein
LIQVHGVTPDLRIRRQLSKTIAETANPCRSMVTKRTTAGLRQPPWFLH